MELLVKTFVCSSYNVTIVKWLVLIWYIWDATIAEQNNIYVSRGTVCTQKSNLPQQSVIISRAKIELPNMFTEIFPMVKSSVVYSKMMKIITFYFFSNINNTMQLGQIFAITFSWQSKVH